MSPQQIEILKSDVNKMLELKIIQSGESNFTSPLMLVEAQGKEARPCIDYRRLNKVTRTQFFPLPNIEELFRKDSLNGPPRSCDLTPLDYFLWGYVKSLVYADKPQTLDHLEDNIPRVIADIRPQLSEKVIENWTSRLDYIRASRGSHISEIIFKM
ncbi:retrovirus-related Pol polyprotein from transposon 17.6 [Trichonephila clavipes]|nr:retrovirus-related Pol polyprotein from transposon 17.6 [Trichonephila clavipes]